jgi:hypothetical protein
VGRPAAGEEGKPSRPFRNGICLDALRASKPTWQQHSIAGAATNGQSKTRQIDTGEILGLVDSEGARDVIEDSEAGKPMRAESASSTASSVAGDDRGPAPKEVLPPVVGIPEWTEGIRHVAWRAKIPSGCWEEEAWMSWTSCRKNLHAEQ